MFSVYVIIFEVLIVILFGAFIRLDSATLDNVDYLIGSIVLLLGKYNVIQDLQWFQQLESLFHGQASHIY
jgi:hypothetical protein